MGYRSSLFALAACLVFVQASYGEERSVKVGQSGVPMVFVKVSPGTFKMGSPAGEAYRRANESQHDVVLSKGYWLGKMEVTQAQWVALMGNNPSKNQGNVQLPVENVSWDDAMKFCQALTAQERQAGRLPEGLEFTLPTEAQWEYACRAGSTSAFSFGGTLDGTQANFDGNHPYGKSDRSPKFLNSTAAVGSYPANAWGFHDMHGNVMEWCRDWYQADLGTVKATDPTGAATGMYRVYRGGNYRDIGAFCRSAFRYFNLPHFKYGYLGFRVALVER